MSGYCEVPYPIGAQVSKPKYNGLAYRRFWAISWLNYVGFSGMDVRCLPLQEWKAAIQHPMLLLTVSPMRLRDSLLRGCMPEVANHTFLPALASPSSQHPTLFSYTMLLLVPSPFFWGHLLCPGASHYQFVWLGNGAGSSLGPKERLHY